MINQNYKLKSNIIIPKLGLGTWQVGRYKDKFNDEVKSIKYALENGYKLIDTAEMYDDAEIVLSEALKNSSTKREDIFIVSKIYPHNANANNFFTSLENSLQRINTNYLDMYLLHWRGGANIKEVITLMEEAKKKCLIKSWGVSNFDIDDMIELKNIEYGNRCECNQVLYHLHSRGIDFSLSEYLEKENIALMTYCPLAQNGDLGYKLLENKVLKKIAKKHNATSSQIALSFIMSFENRIVIPKSTNKNHILENKKSENIILDNEDIEEINKEFPRPNIKTHLDIV